jgi:hypothetical protein
VSESAEIADAAIGIYERELILRFPTGRFHDVYVEGLRTSPKHSDAGSVRVRAWTPREVGIYWDRVSKWRRWGRRTAWLIRRAGRDVKGDGLVQRLARRFDVPLREPADRSSVVSNCHVWRRPRAIVAGGDQAQEAV